ncbi:outer membrane beta-barrel family protein [Capnocytophaga sp.]|uniref:outer membrane beta-barrel family protein n=1 Tax=Capnocytophaga sp. TaxID=44737 RepID=UPI0026DB35EB|nr:outer membrane beta-barrel family protein [Capnocytophaga sp.]MDO5106520.1 outer membrane beta-barrel family protein [Capnocytophaga sp.]
MKKIIFLLVCFVSVNLFSQTFYSVSGRVVDDDNQAVPYAIISVMASDKNEVISQTTTDSEGNFILKVNQNNLKLIIFAVGFESHEQKLSLSDKNTTLSFIKLNPSITELSSVTVSADRIKPAVRLEAGKIIFSPQQSSITSGGNALEALKKTPGILMDNNNAISIFGKKGTAVFINGKSTYMQTEELANLLKTISASQIKNIEVLLNPSAEYDAEGGAGIINIVLNKHTFEGTYVSAGSGISYWNHLRNSTDISVQHNTEKLNINTSYNHNFGNIDYDYGSDRHLDDNFYISSSQDTDKRKAISAHFSLDYSPSDKNTIGFSLKGNTIYGKGIINTQNDIFDKDFKHQKVLIGKSDYIKQRAARYGMNTFYAYQPSENEKYNLDIDYIFFDGLSGVHQPNWHKDSAGNYIPDDAFLSDSDRKVHIFATSLNQKFPLWKGNWSSGIKFSQVVSNNSSDFFTIYPTGNLINPNRSNTFKYSERLLSAYIQYALPINEKLSIEGGLRSEYTFSVGKLFPREGSNQKYQENKRNYINFFPSVNLTYQKSENTTYGLSYSSRIARPAYQDLSPFILALDGLSDWVGNPFLEPQKIYKVSASATWGKTNVLLSYAYTSDFSGQITEKRENERVIMIPRNIGHQNYFSAGILQEIQWASWFKTHINPTVYYNENIFQIENYIAYSPKKWTFSINSQNRIELPYKITGEVSFDYTTKQIVNANEVTKPSGGIDIGLQRNFWENQLNVSLSLTDIFHTRRWDSESHLPNLDNYIWGHAESRQIKFYLTYKLGKQSSKTPHQSSLDEAERL